MESNWVYLLTNILEIEHGINVLEIFRVLTILWLKFQANINWLPM